MMVEYIDRDLATAVIEERQRVLCQVGRYGRGYVYGRDREAYDEWEEILDKVEEIPAADVAPVVHGRWMFLPFSDDDPYQCSCCGNSVPVFGYGYCPNCGAKMDKEGK